MTLVIPHDSYQLVNARSQLQDEKLRWSHVLGTQFDEIWLLVHFWKRNLKEISFRCSLLEPKAGHIQALKGVPNEKSSSKRFRI